MDLNELGLNACMLKCGTRRVSYFINQWHSLWSFGNKPKTVFLVPRKTHVSCFILGVTFSGLELMHFEHIRELYISLVMGKHF